MRLPRLVATDLDGTLLDPQGRVTPFTRDVLAGLWARGVETVFVTARPPRWLDALADAVGGHGLAICANGAFVYDVHRREVVESHGIAAAVVLDVAHDLQAAIPGVGLAVEHARGMHAWPGWPFPDAGVPAGVTVGPVEHADVAEVGKLLARMPGTPGPAAPPAGVMPSRCPATTAFVEEVRRVVGGRAAVHDSGAVGLAEIGPAGVSKATALANWCARQGVEAADVWAFGDMPNDIPMLTWAGRSFAMAGAPDAVRAAATDGCGPNDDDGVARTLARLLD